MPLPNPIANAFDVFNHARLSSPILEDIWRQAYGQDYAADARPDGFYPLSVLERITTAGEQFSTWSSGSVKSLLDIGCGHGMTGLYLAQSLEMKLFGIDVSSASIELAQQNAVERYMEVDAQFWVADARSIPELKDSSCVVVMCLDVLLYLPDKRDVFAEMHRILEPGGLFAFTTWEQAGFSERLGAQQVRDYRPLLEEAGFEIVTYDTVLNAKEQQDRVFEGLIGREDALKQEVGRETASMFVNMARSGRLESQGRRYVFGIARRKEA